MTYEGGEGFDQSQIPRTYFIDGSTILKIRDYSSLNTFCILRFTSQQSATKVLRTTMRDSSFSSCSTSTRPPISMSMMTSGSSLLCKYSTCWGALSSLDTTVCAKHKPSNKYSSKCKLELKLILVDILSGLRGTNLPTVAQLVTLSPATWPLTATSHTLRIRDRESAKCSFYHPSRGKDLEQNCSTRSADPSGTETKLSTSQVSHHRVL